MFTLVKWYLDLVTEDGTAVIGYSARVRTGPVWIGYSSILSSTAGAPAREETAFGAATCPCNNAEVVTWQQPALAVRGRWERLAPPFGELLLDVPVGELRWDCVMPHSRVEIDVCGTRYAGIGYVEQLTLTVPPRHLPFNSLRWGRHASASHSVVWIAWRGVEERRFIWCDGAPQPDAVLQDWTLRGLTNDAELAIGAAREVCARPALARIVDRLPQPARSLARPVGGMFEQKMVAPSQLIFASGEIDQGWSVFEEVRW